MSKTACCEDWGKLESMFADSDLSGINLPPMNHCPWCGVKRWPLTGALATVREDVKVTPINVNAVHTSANHPCDSFYIVDNPTPEALALAYAALRKPIALCDPCFDMTHRNRPSGSVDKMKCPACIAIAKGEKPDPADIDEFAGYRRFGDGPGDFEARVAQIKLDGHRHDMQPTPGSSVDDPRPIKRCTMCGICTNSEFA